MTRAGYLGLFVLGLLAALAASVWVTAPGYMDAEYYFVGGVRLAQGDGLTQSFLWNYLDEPIGLPHPSHTYWMPLASLLASVGMVLSGTADFVAAQRPFILLAACLPPASAWLAEKIGGQAAQARLAGLLAVFPGFYLPYLVTTESFGLYMLLGALIIYLSFSENKANLWQHRPGWRFFACGVLAGFMHLTRADGLLWLMGMLGLAGLEAWKARADSRRLILGARLIALVLIGYLLVMSFWFGRNIQAFGSLMPPGGSRTLWITEYDQTFAYPAALLDLRGWLEAGTGAALRVRLDAFWQNLKTMIGVQGAVVLFPLILAGLWSLRRDRRVRFAIVMWLATLGFMTVAFPFAGARGGFLHSGAAFQLLWWGAAAAGFGVFIRVGVRRRKWNEQRAWRMFTPALVVLMLALTAALYAQRVIGADANKPDWSTSWDTAREINRELVRFGAQPEAIVMINNPPGFSSASGRASIVIPYGGIETTLEVARRYGAAYLVIEENHVQGLDDLYLRPQTDANLEYLGELGAARFFRIIATGGNDDG